MGDYAKELSKSFLNEPKSKQFIILYLGSIVVGLLLALLSIFSPYLSTCVELLGPRVCSPVGVLFIIMVSFPGYLLAAILLYPFPNIPELFSIFVVGLFSFLFYYYLGKALEKTDRTRVPLKNLILWIVIISFVLLVLLFVYLLLLVRQ